MSLPILDVLFVSDSCVLSCSSLIALKVGNDDKGDDTCGTVSFIMSGMETRSPGLNTLGTT